MHRVLYVLGACMADSLMPQACMLVEKLLAAKCASDCKVRACGMSGGGTAGTHACIAPTTQLHTAAMGQCARGEYRSAVYI